MSKELEQFYVYDVLEPLYAEKLSNEEKSKVLTLLIFMKEKRDRKVKGRSCTNRSVQREHLAKEEAPTVALKSVFLTSTIDAKEKWKIVTINLPGAFLHADNNDYIIMKMNGSLSGTHGKDLPEDISKICDTQKRETSFVYAPVKGLIRHAEECPAILYYRKWVLRSTHMIHAWLISLWRESK